MIAETYDAWVLDDGSVHRVSAVPTPPDGAKRVTFYRTEAGTDIRADDWETARRLSYPAAHEQLDALYHLARAIEVSGVDLPAAVTDVLAQIEAVKVAFPKADDE